MGFKHLALNSSNLVGCIDRGSATLASFPVQTYSTSSKMLNLEGALQFLTWALTASSHVFLRQDR